MSTGICTNAAQAPGPHPEKDARSRAQAPTTSKLRDSCHACASSKVKCHKQKPSCSRCTKRGIECEYFTTKRPGRKRDHSHVNANKGRASDTIEVAQYPWLSIISSTTTDPTVPGSNNISRPLNLSPTSPRSDNNLFSDEQPNSGIFSMPYEFSPSGLLGISNEFDGFFNSPTNFSELDTLDHVFLSQGSNDIAKLLIPDDTDHEPLSDMSSVNHSNASKATSSPNEQSLSSNNTSVSHASDSCMCLVQALDIMKKVSSSTDLVSPKISSGDGLSDFSDILPGVTIQVPSAHHIVLGNKETIEVLTTMLQCSCREDGYLLMVLAMIVCRIVGRYAAAAFKHPEEGEEGIEGSGVSTSTKDHKRRPSDCSVDGEELRRRMAAQLILIELHRVQRFINELSLRLQAHGRASADSNNEGILRVGDSKWEMQVSTPVEHLITAAPFSATGFAQLETDMRKCLSTLSSEIIKMLRHI
ncbi:hypothetical protein DL95DRAFT_470096 [Leptodontidium sp. 2 PMI_412]|nr:hypothetical protein DL95DRAFT_470096 [Leptodontidium sp. 2 PMI_412]